MKRNKEEIGRLSSFEDLTPLERDELRRVLSWVLVATQSSDKQKLAILKAMALLECEGVLNPEDCDVC